MAFDYVYRRHSSSPKRSEQWRILLHDGLGLPNHRLAFGRSSSFSSAGPGSRSHCAIWNNFAALFTYQELK